MSALIGCRRQLDIELHYRMRLRLGDILNYLASPNHLLGRHRILLLFLISFSISLFILPF